MSRFTPSAYQGIAHRFAPRLVAFEHKSTTNSSPNTLLWIGGLGDGLLTVPYPAAIAQTLPESWSLTEVLLGSSYTGWGTSNISRDAAEIAKCVSYFCNLEGKKKGKIVLMGHSTGCQDIMEYLVGEEKGSPKPKIDGVILQGSVSDREAMLVAMGKGPYDSSVRLAQKMVSEGKAEDCLPLSVTKMVMGRTPVCAKRWLDLASPDMKGADDYFSSDLGDERLEETFGKIGKKAPVCFLFSGDDEYVPESVDKEGLLKKWEYFIRKGGGVVGESGGIVPTAHHNLEGDPVNVIADLGSRVNIFLDRVQREDFEGSTGSNL